MKTVTASNIAPKPRSPTAEKAALLLAGMIILLALSQLFSFEKFPDVIQSLELLGVNGFHALVIAALIVVAEVLSVPFLLRMRLSSTVRTASMIAGWLVVLWWIFATFWQVIVLAGMSNAAFLGATVQAPVGSWAVFLMLGLGFLTVWAGWGLRPLRRRSKN